jgi:hypothetical protein
MKSGESLPLNHATRGAKAQQPASVHLLPYWFAVLFVTKIRRYSHGSRAGEGHVNSGFRGKASLHIWNVSMRLPGPGLCGAGLELAELSKEEMSGVSL